MNFNDFQFFWFSPFLAVFAGNVKNVEMSRIAIFYSKCLDRLQNALQACPARHTKRLCAIQGRNCSHRPWGAPKENAPSGFGSTKFRDLGTELLQMGE